MIKKIENEEKLRSELCGLEFTNLQNKNQLFIAFIAVGGERKSNLNFIQLNVVTKKMVK